MAGILTRDTIIQQGCQEGGNPGLAKTSAGAVTGSLGDTFFAAFYDHLCRSFDWAFLRKLTTAQADAADFSKIPASALPTDYRAIFRLRAPKAVWMIQRPLEEVRLNLLLDSENAVAASASTPIIYAVDEGAAAGGVPDVYVHPKPATRYTYNLYYYRQPPKLTSNTAPDFPNHKLLVDAVAAWASRFQREPMTAAIEIIARETFAAYRANHADQGRGNALHLEFDEAHFPPPYRVD